MKNITFKSAMLGMAVLLGASSVYAEAMKADTMPMKSEPMMKSDAMKMPSDKMMKSEKKMKADKKMKKAKMMKKEKM